MVYLIDRNLYGQIIFRKDDRVLVKIICNRFIQFLWYDSASVTEKTNV